MSTSVTLRESQDVRELPLSHPLDEAVWQAWLLKGRAQDERSHAVRINAVKWISLTGLLFAAIADVWSALAPYNVVARFTVAAGAMVLMFHAFHARHYVFASVFGALVLLYNPVAPVFSFSGEWQPALAVASTIPLVASLIPRNAKPAPSD